MKPLKLALARIGIPFLDALERMLPSGSGGWRSRLRRRLWLARLRHEDIVQYRVEVARERGVKVGKNCRFYSLNLFSEPYLIEIGDNVIVSGQVIFLTHDGAIYLLKDEIPDVVGSFGRIRIGNNCFIGMGAIILPNVDIGDNCIIAAGAVVNKSFADNSIIMGNPARAVLTLDMYKKLKIGAPHTITHPDFAFPKRISAEERRRLVMPRLEELPPPPAGPPGGGKGGGE